jgi:hypothetical protein
VPSILISSDRHDFHLEFGAGSSNKLQRRSKMLFVMDGMSVEHVANFLSLFTKIASATN